MSDKNVMTVDDVITWARKNDVSLGKSPRRTLTYLAGQGIIPKSVRGARCQGVYDTPQITSRLLFYRDCRRDNWKNGEIRRALDRLTPTGAGGRAHASRHLAPEVPMEDTFGSVLGRFIEEYPDAAHLLVRFVDQLGFTTGSRIGTAFRQFIGTDRRWESVSRQSSLALETDETIHLFMHHRN